MYSPQAIFETGRRNNQEDSLYPSYGTASADDRLFIVCDGAGSESNGNLASKTISNSVASYLRRNTSYDKSFPSSMLGDALDHACQELNKKGGAAEGQGTSFAFLYFHRGGVTAAYLGDSRIYHIRPNSATAANGTANKAIQFVSRDVSGGVSTDAEGAEGQKTTSSRLIFANSTTKPRVSVQHIGDVRQGDYFVICTRGMLENLADEERVGVYLVEVVDELVVVAPVLLVAARALREAPDGRELVVEDGVALVIHVIGHVEAFLAPVLRAGIRTPEAGRHQDGRHRKEQYYAASFHSLQIYGLFSLQISGQTVSSTPMAGRLLVPRKMLHQQSA